MDLANFFPISGGLGKFFTNLPSTYPLTVPPAHLPDTYQHPTHQGTGWVPLKVPVVDLANFFSISGGLSKFFINLPGTYPLAYSTRLPTFPVPKPLAYQVPNPSLRVPY